MYIIKLVIYQTVQDITVSESQGNKYIKEFCIQILKPLIHLRLFPHVIGVNVVGYYFSKNIFIDTHKF